MSNTGDMGHANDRSQLIGRGASYANRLIVRHRSGHPVEPLG
jgi:hypothetical protein